MLWFLDRGVGVVVAHSDDNSENVIEKLLPDLIPPTSKEREEVGKLEGQVAEVVVLEVLRSSRLRDKVRIDEMASFSAGVNRSQVIRCAKLLELLGSGQLLVCQTPRRNPPFATWRAGIARTATDRALRWN